MFRFFRFFIIGFCFIFASCASNALFYSHYKEPFFKDIKNNTEVVDTCYDSNVIRIKDPLFTSIYAEWGSLTPTDVAKKKDIKKVSLVDIEYQSAFLGMIKKHTVWVCGK